MATYLRRSEGDGTGASSGTPNPTPEQLERDISERAAWADKLGITELLDGGNAFAAVHTPEATHAPPLPGLGHSMSEGWVNVEGEMPQLVFRCNCGLEENVTHNADVITNPVTNVSFSGAPTRHRVEVMWAWFLRHNHGVGS